MTEGMNVHVGTKGKKVQQQSTFSQQTQSNKDIALFGDNGNSGVPYQFLMITDINFHLTQVKRNHLLHRHL